MSDELRALPAPRMKLSTDLDVDFLALPLREARREFERHYFAALIEQFDGKIVDVAKASGMCRYGSIWRKIRDLGLATDGGVREDKAEAELAEEDLPDPRDDFERRVRKRLKAAAERMKRSAAE